MKTENPITAKYLKSIGFRQSYKDINEDGELYEVLTLEKGDCRVDCTFTYSSDGDTDLYFELNGEELQGKQMTVARLQSLIELL